MNEKDALQGSALIEPNCYYGDAAGGADCWAAATPLAAASAAAASNFAFSAAESSGGLSAVGVFAQP